MVLADDLGYGDVQCNNPERGKIPTPNIDRLAAQGMRFTDGHSSSGVCSPSRYALLTGRYHWRTRLQSGIVGYLEGPLIAPDRLTIASMLKQHGYHTACIGKWHLGWNWNLNDKQKPLFTLGRAASGTATEAHRQAWQEVYGRAIEGGPTTRGFDSYFGTDVPNWPPYCFIENDRTLGIPTEFLPKSLLESKSHLASIGGPAIEDWKLEGILPALTQRACDYIHSRSTTQQPFFLYLPLTTPHTPLAVNEAWKGKSGLGMPVADLIMETDATVGRVLEAIEKAGIADNTFVFFSSDNGFAKYVGVQELEKQGHFPSGPLRGYKTDVFEGGHRVAYIVRWPKLVKPGSLCTQLVHHADLISTLAEIVEHPLAENAAEDSFSLMPLLRGGDQPIREHAVSCSSAGMPGLRVGNWKYIADAEPRLYNLGVEINEQTNLAEQEPDRLASMKALLEKLISDGRSNSGPKQSNDIRVVRHPRR